MRMKSLPVILLLVIVLAITACTRSASRTSGQSAGGEGELPFPTPADGTPDVMGTLLAGGFATQTAIAQQLAGGTAQVTGEEPLQATPVPQDTTDTPPDEEPPTQQPPEPTATPEPREEEKEKDEDKDKDKDKDKDQDKSACDSPYTVNRGEWVYSIARKCGVEPNEIIAANGLVPPYLLYPGNQLKIPGGGDDKDDDKPKKDKKAVCASPYTVQPGEWVYAIARKCGTTPQAIISANGLVPPYSLSPGDKLKIP